MKGYSDFSPDICALREGNLRWSIDLPQRTRNRKIRINDVEGDVVLKWRAEVHRLTFFWGGGDIAIDWWSLLSSHESDAKFTCIVKIN